ncbi:trypsin-like serine peptidase [Streptomyces neyagawaensis]|uniref:Secreted protein n=1 Tax=Streptomyces neyagawaensis TaxID=42238 RepID=A0ABV3AZJ2_9ACTN
MRFSYRRQPLLAATGLIAVLALTATACGSADGGTSDKPDVAASRTADRDGDGVPDVIADRLEEHGVDVDDWQGGGWKDWDEEQWLGEAEEFFNPVIEDLWDAERMREAEDPAKTISSQDASVDQGVSDPPPAPVEATPEKTPYHVNAGPVGKIFFDSPEGAMVCSGTVVSDENRPGRSNLVWTAGHCVHAGSGGGWYRNIVFVPAYNDLGRSEEELAAGAPAEEVAPFGQWWADWAATSDEWIAGGSQEGGAGAAYDYAVLHVKPEAGSKSLEETVGSALDVDFSAPAASGIDSLGAWGYPAAPPYNGLTMFRCIDRPGRLSLDASLPTMYRIGCTMTGGSSGGGWFRMVDGAPRLVSNTSIGPADNTWLAGPRLGKGAKALYDDLSMSYGGR